MRLLSIALPSCLDANGRLPFPLTKEGLAKTATGGVYGTGAVKTPALQHQVPLFVRWEDYVPTFLPGVQGLSFVQVPVVP